MIPGIPMPSREQIDSFVEHANSLAEFLKKQFGLTEDADFEGLLPIAVLLYGPAKEFLVFLHNMLIIQGQVMNWLQNAGADIQSAVTTVSNPVLWDPIIFPSLPGGV